MSEQEVKVTENVAETESAAAEAQEAEAKTYTQEQLQAEIDRVVKARLDRQKRDEDKRTSVQGGLLDSLQSTGYT